MNFFKKYFQKKRTDYFVIENFLTQNVCSTIIEIIETNQFNKAHQYSMGRHNKEIFISNSQIEKILNDALFSFKFSNLKILDYSKPHEFYKYDSEDYIKPHTDGAREFNNQTQSNYTLIIYLNSNFVGGETNFSDLKVKVTPKTGNALFFKHTLVHEALTVTNGVKYIFRTNCLLT